MTEPLRVVQYHPRAAAGDGGITRSVRSLSAGMATAGARPAIAYNEEDPGDTPEGPVDWIGVPHRRVGPQSVPVGLSGALQRVGADVAILNSGWAAHNVVAGRAARAAAVPYVVADRGAYDPLILRRRAIVKRLWWAGFERRLVGGAAALHAFFADQIPALRSLGWDGPVIVAPNGVRVPPERRWDGGSGGYLLFVGRFDPEHKGLDLLVDAVASLPPARRPEVRLHGPDWRGGKSRVTALIARREVGRWVRVGPPVYGEEKWDLVTAARGFVYPSRWEAFGNSPAEAAALGVPVLATPYPLARYLEGLGAALVTEADPGALAGGLEALAAGTSPLGARGEEVRAALTWEEVARSWLDQLATLR